MLPAPEQVENLGRPSFQQVGEPVDPSSFFVINAVILTGSALVAAPPELPGRVRTLAGYLLSAVFVLPLLFGTAKALGFLLELPGLPIATAGNLGFFLTIVVRRRNRGIATLPPGHERVLTPEIAFRANDIVRVRVDQWTITLDTYCPVTHGGDYVGPPETRLRAPFISRRDLHFRVEPRTLLGMIYTALGRPDIAVGDPAFDRAFSVQATDPDTVRALFASPGIRTTLLAHPSGKFELKDDEGLFGPRFDERVDELCFTEPGMISDAGQIHGLFDLFAETLRRLCALGAVSEFDPGVTL